MEWFIGIIVYHDPSHVNSLRPRDAYMRQETNHHWPAPSHYLNQWWNIVNWTIGNKFHGNLNKKKLIHFHSRKCVWKCRLENCGHFVSASICYADRTPFRMLKPLFSASPEQRQTHFSLYIMPCIHWIHTFWIKIICVHFSGGALKTCACIH